MTALAAWGALAAFMAWVGLARRFTSTQAYFLIAAVLTAAVVALYV
jgi:hypothetical protein